MECLDDATVLAFVGGGLGAQLREQIDAHLDGCATCLKLVAEMVRVSHTTSPSVYRHAPASSHPLERYVIGREIARGGMGQVVAAHDRYLDRPVALKFSLDSSLSAARFAREVAVTSRLEHPSIVPVHDAGVLDDGAPFYVMRLVAGRTLAALIDEAHTLQQRLALLPHLLAVADAVAYAHNRGIVHRDLKPQNILVGDFGETVLLDWGLAKDLRCADESEASEVVRVLRSCEHDSVTPGSKTTQAGETVGTPAYMAPEQAAGEEVDERADVYGLGATLYHLLTGRPPHEHRLASTRAAKPLGAWVKGVPRDLCAIVERAMALRPAERYASGRELAQDLHRFHTGRLVAAHQYSWAQRIGRWTRRHRAVVSVAAIATVSLAALSIASVDRIVDERGQAEAARALAEQRGTAAEKLVTFLLEEHYQNLKALGKLSLLSGTSREVEAYYAGLEATDAGMGSDSVLRHSKAIAVAGDVHHDVGRASTALADYERALALVDTLNGDDDEVAQTRCRLYTDIGIERFQLGQDEAAAEALEACRALAIERIERGGPRQVWVSRWGQATRELANLKHRRGDGVTAKRLILEALQLAEPLDPDPDVLGLRGVLHNRLATWAVMDERWDEAEVAAAASLAAAQQRYDADPSDVAAGYSLSVAQAQLGQIWHYQQRDLQEVERVCRASFDIAKTVLAREPADLATRVHVARVEALLSQLARSANRSEQAREYARASLDDVALLLALEPEYRNGPIYLAESAAHLGDVEDTFGDPAAARDAYRQGIDVLEGALTATPQDFDVMERLAVSHDRLALVLRKLGDRDGAIVAVERAIELRRQVYAAMPSPVVAEGFMQHLLLLAQLAPQRAGELLEEARQLAVDPRGDAGEQDIRAQVLAGIEALARPAPRRSSPASVAP